MKRLILLVPILGWMGSRELHTITPMDTIEPSLIEDKIEEPAFRILDNTYKEKLFYENYL